MKMLRVMVLAVAALIFGMSTAAPASEDVLIVYDASGSMWGQIDGVNKVVIARDVMADLVNGWPADTNLGLVAYGHRHAGDCSDIETLIEPGPVNRQQFIDTVNAINPKGKTPIAAALEHAAKVLKYRDTNATIVLISDGLESCHGDPCAVARALEENGVNFTAHVVGFDLDEQGNAALSCIANNTGGIFVPASNAAELEAALQRVQAKVEEQESAAEPESQPVAEPEPPVVAKAEAQLVATDLKGGPVISSGLHWTVRHGATGDIIFEADDAGVVTAKLPAGVHDVEVERVSDGATATAELELPPKGTKLTVPIVVEVLASIKAPTSAPAGSHVRVTWTGPNKPKDYVAVFKPETSNGANDIHFFYTKGGNPQNLKMPERSGTYEIRYILHDPRKALAKQDIEVTPISASLEAPESAPAGSNVRVVWEGPDYADDYIGVFKPDGGNKSDIHFFYTKKGNPYNLKMPEEPGTYEIRYILHSSRQDLARRSIEATPISAALDVPASAPAGSNVRVAWEGPDYTDDYIGVFKPDGGNKSDIHYFYTKRGNPYNLKMPDEPGTYEIRYVLHSSRTDLARVPIEVTPD